MKKMHLKNLFFLAGIALFAACSTDVEINAPYDSKSIVFGLLDSKADTQFVKINKTFLGDGNNLEYALIRDSSEYRFSAFETLEVEEVVNGNITNSFSLDTITVNNKSVNGIFYGPRQTVYYFKTPASGLNQQAKYRFKAVFNNGEDALNAETDIIENAFINGDQSDNIELPNPYLTDMNELAGANTLDNGVFPNVNFKWNATDGAARYEATLRFYYTEVVYTNGTFSQVQSSTVKYVDWALGDFETAETDGSDDFSAFFSGQSFFTAVRGQVDVVQPNQFIRRYVGYLLPDNNAPQPAFDFLLNVANEELHVYLNVTEPVTGIIQERPVYTNVANGLGLFAARITQGVYRRLPKEYTINFLHNMFEEVAGNQLSYGFYSRDIRFSTKDFYLPD